MLMVSLTLTDTDGEHEGSAAVVRGVKLRPVLQGPLSENAEGRDLACATPSMRVNLLDTR